MRACLPLFAALAVSACDIGSTTDNGNTAAPAPALSNLKRGVNLGNALDAPNEGDWGVTLSSATFELAASGGFDHVRLPVRFSNHAAATAPFALDEEFMQRVDWALDQAQANQLGLVLDLHHYEEIHDDVAGHQERFVALWTQIATRYRARPDSVLFELLNEPHGFAKGSTLADLYRDALTAIRQSNPTRWVVLDATEWADAAALSELSLPGDAHVAVSFHAYNPKLFTVQGAPWMPPEYQTTGVLFPGPPATPLAPVAAVQSALWASNWFGQYNSQPTASNPSGPSTIRRDFELGSAYASKHGVPVYVGEFAAVDWADDTSRANYLRAVRSEAELRNMAWCVWDDGGHNQLLDVAAKSFRRPLYDALFGP